MGKEIFLDYFKNFIYDLRSLKDYPDFRNRYKSISMSQGTVIPNMLACKLIKETSMIVKEDYTYNEIRPFATTDPKDQISCEQLIDFLSKEVKIIENMQIVNYDTLSEYHNGFSKRICNLFEKAINNALNIT